jgi:hypothetical protein
LTLVAMVLSGPLLRDRRTLPVEVAWRGRHRGAPLQPPPLVQMLLYVFPFLQAAPRNPPFHARSWPLRAWACPAWPRELPSREGACGAKSCAHRHPSMPQATASLPSACNGVTRQAKWGENFVCEQLSRISQHSAECEHIKGDVWLGQQCTRACVGGCVDGCAGGCGVCESEQHLFAFVVSLSPRTRRFLRGSPSPNSAKDETRGVNERCEVDRQPQENVTPNDQVSWGE